MFLEVKLNVVGLYLNIIVFYYGTAEIVYLVVPEILNRRVVTASVNLGVNIALTPAGNGKKRQTEEKNDKKTICWPRVQDFYLIL